MKQRLPIVIFTAAVFGAGYGAHMWLAGEPTVPPPPAAVGSEFSHGPGTPAATAAAADSKIARHAPPAAGTQPFDRAKLVSEIQRYSSQIKAYQKRLDELDAEFEAGLLPLLDDKQRERLASLKKRWEVRRAKGQAAIAAETAPLSDEQIFRLQRSPLMGVLSSVSISMRFDQLAKEIKLTAGQEAKVRELLVARREKFLALIDQTTPPTITLSQLALHAERLRAEPANPEPPK